MRSRRNSDLGDVVCAHNLLFTKEGGSDYTGLYQ